MKNLSLICSGAWVAMSGSADRPFSALFTEKYSWYIGNSFMKMKRKKPTTAITMTKLVKVMPLCLRRISVSPLAIWSWTISG